MTTELTRGLATLADESRDYTDAGAAVAAARRHRRRAIMLPVAGGLAVVLVAAVVASGPAAVRTRPADPKTEVVLTLPPVVTPPTGDVTPLPADRAVGPGVLAYRPCPTTCPAYLVTTSGEVYGIDVPHWAPGVGVGLTYRVRDLAVSLSPDGRYLAISVGDTTTVRDLTGTGVKEVSIGNVVAWSANDRYIVNFVDRVDLWTGTVTVIRTMDNGVTDGGQVLFDDPQTTTIVRSLPDGSTVIDAASVLREGETLSPKGGRATRTAAASASSGRR